jgi:DNA repair protein RadC
MSAVLHDVAALLVAEAEAAEANFVTEPGVAVAIFRPMLLNPEQERFGVIAVDRKGRMVDSAVLTTGNDVSTVVCPRQVLRWALTRARPVSAIVVGHNHPSGDATPSVLDKEVTRRLAAACATITLPLHDHIIVTGTRYWSFAEAGLIGSGQ